jgi:hypothetical protein
MLFIMGNYRTNGSGQRRAVRAFPIRVYMRLVAAAAACGIITCIVGVTEGAGHDPWNEAEVWF